MTKLYTHHANKNVYEVIDDNVKDCTNIRQADTGTASERLVLYREVGKSQLYIRTHAEFFELTPKGVPRFAPCDSSLPVAETPS